MTIRNQLDSSRPSTAHRQVRRRRREISATEDPQNGARNVQALEDAPRLGSQAREESIFNIKTLAKGFFTLTAAGTAYNLYHRAPLATVTQGAMGNLLSCHVIEASYGVDLKYHRLFFLLAAMTSLGIAYFCAQDLIDARNALAEIPIPRRRDV